MNNLDQCLTQLAEILKRIGVEEMTISEDSQHHIINNETEVNENLLNRFCSQVQQLYTEAQDDKIL